MAVGNLKTQSEHSGLRPDTSSLVYIRFFSTFFNQRLAAKLSIVIISCKIMRICIWVVWLSCQSTEHA